MQSKLKVYTSVRPEEETVEDKKSARRVKWKPVPRTRSKLDLSERLLRNTAIACSVLLCVLTLKNVNTNWSRAVFSRIEQALTMKIDLDESLGSLSFVRNLVPESALVFFNITGENEMIPPVSGELEHAYSEAQPWLLFECEQNAAVTACKAGVISAISKLTEGEWGVIIDHGSALESVCAYLEQPVLNVGDQVEQGAEIGRAAANYVYFELRKGGVAVDPTDMIGLSAE